MTEKIQYIPSRLKNAAVGGHIGGTEDIIDDALGKEQSQINQETIQALNDRYTKSQTYNKTELDSMITTPEQQYVTLTATDGDTLADIFDGVTGAADTIYRVGSWDGEQYDATVYSEYAFDGTNFVYLSTKTQIGEVFDISLAHASGGELAKYADLSEALGTNGANVPEGIRKGGMSVKFVNSDNKYIWYRLTIGTFSSDTIYWQKEDVSIQDNILYVGDSPVMNVTGTDWVNSSLNQYINALYIEKPQVAVSYHLGLWTIDYLYGAVYFKDKKNDTERQLGYDIITRDGKKVVDANDEDYGHIYMELASGDGHQHRTAPYFDNICLRSFSYDYYANKRIDNTNAYVEAKVDSLDGTIYGQPNDPYLQDTNLNPIISRIFIENRDAAVTNKLYLSYVQYTYNVIYLGVVGGSATAIGADMQTLPNGNKYIDVDDVTYGRVYVEVIAGSGNYGAQNAPNLLSKCFNPFPENGILGEVESIGKSKWAGKKMLAIGDSITAANKWQQRVGQLLGMQVTTHAEGGIGVVSMVDGEPSHSFPALSTSDVADKDLILIGGFYNDRDEAYLHPGNQSDMYPTDSNSYIGKINYAIKKIYEKLADANNTKAKIVVFTAHKYGKYDWIDRSAYTLVTSEGQSIQDGEALFSCIKKAADYNSIYLIDLMHGGNINQYNWNNFQSSPSAANQKYIPADGVNDGTNKPFASLADAPSASDNQGKYITVTGVSGCYYSNGSTWETKSIPCIWNGDQLHPNNAGYERIGDFIAGHLLNI